MLANSGDIQNGQSRAKQSAARLMGVCREHGPTPEGKMCSELHGNMQNPAEMTGSFS